jgi:hypothetical protein
MKRISRPKREKIIGGWLKLRFFEEADKPCPSQNILTKNKLIVMR